MCLVTQLRPTLWDPMDCSPPGSSVHGVSLGKKTGVGCQALLQGIFLTQGLNPGLPHCRLILYHLSHQGSPRILEWAAHPFSRGSSWPRDQLASPTLQADSLPAQLPEMDTILVFSLQKFTKEEIQSPNILLLIRKLSQEQVFSQAQP